MTPKGRPPPVGAVAGGGVLRAESTGSDRSARAAWPRNPPAKGALGTRSRVQITVCGPMIAAAMPPAITHEIARPLNASEAESAAAKR